MAIPREVETAQELVTFGPWDHAAVTASTLWNLFPARRTLVIDSAKYYSAAGLAEDASNTFAVKVAKLALVTIADFTFVGEADDDNCTATAHGLQTGDGPLRVSNSGGALPTGLAAATDYFAIRTGANTFKLATTRENAFAGTAIDITGDGSGTQTLSDTATTRRLTTVADGIDTDSDGAGSNSLAAGVWTALTLASGTAIVLDAGDQLCLCATEQGTATLPAGRLFVEGRYVT